MIDKFLKSLVHSKNSSFMKMGVFFTDTSLEIIHEHQEKFQGNEHVFPFQRYENTDAWLWKEKGFLSGA